MRLITTVEAEQFWNGGMVKEKRHAGFDIQVFVHEKKREYIAYLVSDDEANTYALKTAFSSQKDTVQFAKNWIDKKGWLECI